MTGWSKTSTTALAQGAAAVEHNQDQLGHVQAAVAQPDKQTRCQGDFLGPILAKCQRMLDALQVDAKRHDTTGLGGVHPADHHRHQVQSAQNRR